MGPVKAYRWLYILAVAIGPYMTLTQVWTIADITNGLMAIPNLICLAALSGLVAKITKNSFDRRRGEKIEPMLSAYPDMNEEFKRDLELQDAEMH